MREGGNIREEERCLQAKLLLPLTEGTRKGRASGLGISTALATIARKNPKGRKEDYKITENLAR